MQYLDSNLSGCKDNQCHIDDEKKRIRVMNIFEDRTLAGSLKTSSTIRLALTAVNAQGRMEATEASKHQT